MFEYNDETVYTYTSDPDYTATQPYEQVVQVADKSDATLLDVYNGDVSIEEFVAKMSLEELATLNCGSGWGVANENTPVVGSSSIQFQVLLEKQQLNILIHMVFHL